MHACAAFVQTCDVYVQTCAETVHACARCVQRVCMLDRAKGFTGAGFGDKLISCYAEMTWNILLIPVFFGIQECRTQILIKIRNGRGKSSGFYFLCITFLQFF